MNPGGPRSPLATFETEVRSFLSQRLERRRETGWTWGEGSDRLPLFDEHPARSEDEALEAAKNWQGTKYAAGLGWITGPARYGGRELTAEHLTCYREVEAEFDAPYMGPLNLGLNMIGPTILEHACAAVHDRYLRALYRGDVVACQLFSEPGAGSDLASVQTSAVRDGDRWLLNGQKVWTSGAQHSDIGEIICRTNREAPKHRGITAFVVDMHAPGVEVRPLRQMTGGTHFNEVFLSDVRVPDDHRLGDVDGGWKVAITTLMNERASLGGGSSGLLQVVNSQRMIATARAFGAADDPVARQSLADLHIRLAVNQLLTDRYAATVTPGQAPGTEMSLTKLAYTRNLIACAELAGRMLGTRAVADTGEWGTFAWANFMVATPAMRILGGTEEILKNTVAERVLGLPKD